MTNKWGPSPFRGLPFSERRRLNRLSQSERPIHDPDDAKKVYEVLKRLDSFHQSWLWKGTLIVTSLGGLSYFVGLVLSSLHRHWYHVYGDAFWLAVILVALLSYRRRRRSQRLTIAANNWEMSKAR